MNLRIYEEKELWLECVDVIPESLKIELTKIDGHPEISQLLFFSSLRDGEIITTKNGIPFTSNMSFYFVENEE